MPEGAIGTGAAFRLAVLASGFFSVLASDLPCLACLTFGVSDLAAFALSDAGLESCFASFLVSLGLSDLCSSDSALCAFAPSGFLAADVAAPGLAVAGFLAAAGFAADFDSDFASGLAALGLAAAGFV